MSDQTRQFSEKEQESAQPRKEEAVRSASPEQASRTPPAPTGFRFVVPTTATATGTGGDAGQGSDREANQSAAPVKAPQVVFGGVTESVDQDVGAADDDGAAETLGEEDASTADWKPLVQLDLVQIKSGEEDEDVVAKYRAKLYRFDKSMREWKERGTGEIKFLKHRVSGRIRLLMRRQQTLKICANHYLLPEMRLEENMGSDRSWVWTAVDYADEERDEAVLAIRFKDSETAKRFYDTFEELRKEMQSLLVSGKSATEQSRQGEQTAI
jgi:Ran-binding protein 1